MASLTIDLWTDVVCPWCWIGKHRLERALKQAGVDDAGVEWHFHAYELGPRDAKPMAESEMLQRKYGGSAADIDRMFDRVRDIGSELGLRFDFEHAVSSPSFDAHRLIKAAEAAGTARAMLESLHRAHFEQGLDVSDMAVLRQAALSGGLAAAEIERVLGGDAYAADVEEDERRAVAYEIRGVPFTVFNGRFAVAGAQNVETFVKTLKQAGA